MQTLNCNDTVWIKLNDLGRNILRCKWSMIASEAMKRSGTVLPYHPPEEDSDGWSRWQLWRVMELFGPHMHIGMDIPFEPDIRLTD